MITYNPAKLTTALQRAGIPLVTFRTFHDPCWLAGGAVRDLLLGRDPVDLDLVTPTRSLELARLVAAAVRGNFFLLDEERRYYRVVSGPLTVDITPLRDTTIEGDLLRRDVSINAIAIDPANPGRLIDPANGVEDLRAGVVRHLLPETFRDDPGRMAKAVRHATAFQFAMAVETAEKIREDAPLICRVAPERTGEEFRRILATPYAVEGFRLLSMTGLLPLILTGLDVGEEGISRLSLAEERISEAASLAEDIAVCAADLRLAVALEGNDQEVVSRILEKGLRYSKGRAASVAAILKLPASLPEWFSADRRSLLWLHQTCGRIAEVIPALAVRYAPHIDCSCARRLIERLPDVVEKGRIIQLLATADILRETGLTPGPALGALQRHLLACEVAGVIKTPEDAGNYLKEISKKGIDFANLHSYTAPRSDMRE